MFVGGQGCWYAWASLGWYVVVVIQLFATSVAMTWHLGLSSEVLNRTWGCLLTCGRKQPDGDDVPCPDDASLHRVDLAWARCVGDVTLGASSGCCGWCWPRVTVVTWHWWLGVGGWALVARRRDRDRWWWWLRKSSVWLVDDAKSNVGKHRRLFRKVDAKPTYI